MNRKCLQFITCLSLGMNLFLCTCFRRRTHKSSIVYYYEMREPYGLITVTAATVTTSAAAAASSAATDAVIHNLNHNFEIQHRYNMQYCPCTLVHIVHAGAVLCAILLLGTRTTQYTNYGSNVTTPFTKQFYLSLTHTSYSVFAILHFVVFSSFLFSFSFFFLFPSVDR